MFACTRFSPCLNLAGAYTGISRRLSHLPVYSILDSVPRSLRINSQVRDPSNCHCRAVRRGPLLREPRSVSTLSMPSRASPPPPSMQPPSSLPHLATPRLAICPPPAIPPALLPCSPEARSTSRMGGSKYVASHAMSLFWSWGGGREAPEKREPVLGDSVQPPQPVGEEELR